MRLCAAIFSEKAKSAKSKLHLVSLQDASLGANALQTSLCRLLPTSLLWAALRVLDEAATGVVRRCS